MTITRPGSVAAGDRPERDGESTPRRGRSPFGWWRMRSWRKDVALLARVRAGTPYLGEEGGAATGEATRGQRRTVEPPPVSPRPPAWHESQQSWRGRAYSGRAAGGAAPHEEYPSLPRAADRSTPLAGWGGSSQPDTATGDGRHAQTSPSGPTLVSEVNGHHGPPSAGAPTPTVLPRPEPPPPLGQPDPAVAAIRSTFERIAEAGDKAISYFYARLFLADPGARSLFPPAMDEQRDRFFRALARIVEGLSSPEELAEYLTQLGRDHRKYQVEPAMYEAAGEALIATFRNVAPDEFTPAAEDAWRQAYEAASALMIRAAEEDEAVSPAFWTAEVVDVEERAPGIVVVTVAPDQLFQYEPGQHLTVQTRQWPRVWRAYSVACRPREDGLIHLHVKAVPGGWVSSALVHHTRPGDEVTLGPALGTMTLPAAENRDLLLVAGGTGLSPLKAIAEEAIKQAALDGRRQIFTFYGARRRDELYDLRDLWRLSDAYPGFQLTPVTSDDPAFEGMQGNVGRVAARYLPHTECEAYVAGPVGMVRETIRVLVKAGIPRTRIHFDDALLSGHERVGTGT